MISFDLIFFPQVLTRLLCSSSPLLYWYVGVLYVQDNHRLRTKLRQNLHVRQDTDFTSDILTNTGAPDFWLHTLATQLNCDFIVDVAVRWPGLSLKFRAVFIYCVLYSVVGTVMFCNFLPWT